MSVDNWRKVVGLRNALVHDYLNIEPEVIESILRHHYYRELIAFIRLSLEKNSSR
jgi:uncharacterized protein YutE (UPF0331/DUF86 family)